MEDQIFYSKQIFELTDKMRLSTSDLRQCTTISSVLWGVHLCIHRLYREWL